jgi:large subunit ribosomal protein L11
MIVKLLIDGGEMKPGPAVAQKLGPLGINMGKVMQEVNKATAEFKGIKVPINLDVDPKTKTFKVEVFSPPTSELLKKELGLEKGTGDHKANKVGNASIEQIIKVTKTKFPNMLAKEFKSAVKSVIGSCTTLGVLVENKVAKDLTKDIDNNLFNQEISSQKTETSFEKKQALKDYFDNLLKKQEEAKKAAEAAKLAEEAAKLAAAGTTPAAPGAAANAKPGEAAPAVAAGTTPAAPGKSAAPAAKGKEKPGKEKK